MIVFRMRLKNSTSMMTEKVREIIRFVRPNGIANFDVKVADCKSAFKGRAYTQGSGYHATANPFVNVYVGGERHFPMRSWSGKGYIQSLVLSREEALVHVMAHELRHLWQKRYSRGMVWGSRGRYSERDADAYAIHKVREWRSANRMIVGG